MNSTVKTTFWGLVAVAGLLVATPAKADRVSFGLGISDGYGSTFSFGLNSGGRGYGGPSYHGDGYGRSRGDLRVGCGYAVRPPCPPAVVYVPRPVVYASPVVVQSGYWQERDERYWIEGNWVETFDAYGRRCKMWQPGRWEIRRIREWVQP